MSMRFTTHLNDQLTALEQAGLFKTERAIAGPQSGRVALSDASTRINLCANNYLGLSNDAQVVNAAHAALDRAGYGMSSVRFICGTNTLHQELEARLSRFLGMEDTILYSSCFDANTGLFETLLGPEDAVISDALNHASIIDGVRLCKARRLRYANSDMDDLRAQLIASQDARFRLIATDGVFSMDGYIARLAEICDLAEEFDAMVMVDDSHAVGFLGSGGRGSIEHCQVMGRVDIVTGTLGKALGGASGGYTAASAEIVQWLRQRSRPYLFSNALAPVITAASLVVLDMIEGSSDARDRLMANTRQFRSRMTAAGFDILEGTHPIVPVMLRDPKLAQDMAARLDARGVFVAPFSFPVVPKGQDRIRTQMSAAHAPGELDQAIDIFIETGKDMGLIR